MLSDGLNPAWHRSFYHLSAARSADPLSLLPCCARSGLGLSAGGGHGEGKQGDPGAMAHARLRVLGLLQRFDWARRPGDTATEAGESCRVGCVLFDSCFLRSIPDERFRGFMPTCCSHAPSIVVFVWCGSGPRASGSAAARVLSVRR